MTQRSIPVTALAGFLGSGKTTLLNHILEHNHGMRIGVVVNDYGDVNIDGQLVADQTDGTLELTNGCICCSMDSMELDEAIGQFTYPGSPIDYIIIEASGLAEPADLASTLRNSLNADTTLDSIVAVLDAANLDGEAGTATTAQIEHSDFVVINKTDLADSAEVARIQKLITDVSPRTRSFTTVKGALDVRLLLDQGAHDFSDAPPPQADSHHDHHHLHEHYTSVSFTSNRPLDPAAFQTFVNQQIPQNVYRVKGFVNLGAKGHDRKYIFQLVGKRAELTWTQWEGEPPRTQLVFIGRGFDTAALRQLAAACIDRYPQAIDPGRRIILPRHTGL
jgi:G3E family GTPase